MNKKTYLIVFFILFFILFYFCLSTVSYGSYPSLVSKIIKAFEKIKTWLIKIATPAAAVSVGTGVFMRKFSFGDEEKIRTGKNLIKGSLFSYCFILVIDLILSAIESLLG